MKKILIILWRILELLFGLAFVFLGGFFIFIFYSQYSYYKTVSAGGILTVMIISGSCFAIGAGLLIGIGKEEYKKRKIEYKKYLKAREKEIKEENNFFIFGVISAISAFILAALVILVFFDTSYGRVMGYKSANDGKGYYIVVEYNDNGKMITKKSFKSYKEMDYKILSEIKIAYNKNYLIIKPWEDFFLYLGLLIFCIMNFSLIFYTAISEAKKTLEDSKDSKDIIRRI